MAAVLVQVQDRLFMCTFMLVNITDTGAVLDKINYLWTNRLVDFINGSVKLFSVHTIMLKDLFEISCLPEMLSFFRTKGLK